TLGAVLSVLGTNNNTVLAGPRYLYALAESERLPAIFARVHPKYSTPYVAILTQTAVALLLMLTGTAEQLAVLSAIARLATYMCRVASARAPPRKMPKPPRTIRLPGGALIPILAFAICLLFLSAAEKKNWIGGGIALAVGAVIYALGPFRSRRSAERLPP